MSNMQYLTYILVMAGVTYLLRMLPMTLFKRKIKSRFLKSFIFYVPYAVLSAMTVPAIFYCTEELIPSVIGMLTAVAIALIGGNLITVAVSASASVLIATLVMLLF